jgi:phage N-6-adenine-methyltransferase
MKVHYSSKSNEWATPKGLFDLIDGYFHFTLDPCCTDATAKCKEYFTKQEDGLARDWGKRVVFVNPPYGKETGKWVRKAYWESKAGATVVMLIPARTDTSYFHEYCFKGEVLFLRGRIKFEQKGKKKLKQAPFPSCLVVFPEPGTQPLVVQHLLKEIGEQLNNEKAI